MMYSTPILRRDAILLLGGASLLAVTAPLGSVSAKSPKIAWYHRFDDRSYRARFLASSTALAELPDGGSIIALKRRTTDGDLIWFVRFDKAGRILWPRGLKGSQNEAIEQLLALPEGGFAAFTKTSAQPRETYAFHKFGPTGEVQWSQKLGSQLAVINDVAHVPGRGFFYAGRNLKSRALIGRLTETGAPSGERALTINNPVPGESSYSALALAGTPDGGLLVGTRSDGIPMQTGGGRRLDHKVPMRSWIWRFDQRDRLVWRRLISSPRSPSGIQMKLAATRDGGALLVTDGVFVAGARAPWAARVNKNGGVLWRKTVGGPARSIAPNGNVVLIGGKSGKLQAIGLDGRERWAWQPGQQFSGAEFARVIATADGGAILLGGTAATDDIRPQPSGTPEPRIFVAQVIAQ